MFFECLGLAKPIYQNSGKGLGGNGIFGGGGGMSATFINALPRI